VAYNAEINVSVKNLKQVTDLEAKLSSISRNVNALNKGTGGGRRGGGGGSVKSELSDEQKLIQLENKRLTIQNRGLGVTRKVIDLQTKGKNLDEATNNLAKVKSLTDQDQLDLAKNKILLADQQVKKRGIELKVERDINAEASKRAKFLKGAPTGFTAAQFGPQMAPTKGAGQAAMSIDTITKQSDKRLRIELKLRELEVKGVNTAKLRGKMGELVDAQNRKQFGDIKRINREIGRGIAKEESKLKILQLQNKERAAGIKSSAKMEAIRQGNFAGSGPGVFGPQPRKSFRERIGATKGFDTQSALISGAFPLLFGQGPIGALAGGLGGGIGGMFGTMGGFAGGIAATAIVQQIQSAISGISELGKALGPFAKNTDAVTAALGLQGSAEEARIQMIEKTKGKTAAFNAAMQVMKVQIGEKGVNALTEFGETTRLMNTQFAIAITRIGAFTAGILNFVNKTLGIQQGLKEGEANRALKLGIAEKDERALELQARQAEIDAMPKVKQIVDVPGIDGPQKQIIALPSKQAEQAQAVLDLDKQRFSVIRKTEAEAALLTEKFDSLIRANEKEEKLTARVLELRKNGLNPEVAKTVAEIEKGASISKEALDVEITKLQNNKELDINQKARLDTLIAERNAIDEGVKGLDKKLQKTHDLTEAATQTLDAFENINRTIQNDIKEGIKGLIKGTSTLGDLLNNVADRFLDIALNQGLFGNAGGKTITGGLFKMLGFADGGRPPVNRPSIVGEKGPELFVPRSSGTIVPNNKLGGGGSTSVVVNVDASGSDVQGDDAGAKELGTLISVAVQGELIKQQRPGGLLASVR
jgi:hypothetical protein